MSSDPSQTEQSLRDARVLVVDDEASARELNAFVLEQSGAHVRTAMSTAEALHWLEHESFDVLVADLAMPVEDGFALIEAVRSNRNSSHYKIAAVAVSGLTARADRDRAIKSGFNWYLGKPIEPYRLVALVATALQSARGNAEDP
jgi:CheY-like chemotaxis protein